ncbi:hypothetical protein ACFO3D_13865 [Virgibacillus kekensis]|uniref:Lipoprotein n=1 Tax=Virgibacillus kekensis TaxID=202261 RepID=A0ABV9DM91_9BACI
MNKKILSCVIVFFLSLLTGCSKDSQEEPPDASAKVNNQQIEVFKGTYSWDQGGIFSAGRTVADSFAPFQIPDQFDLEMIVVEPGSVATITFTDGSNPKLEAYLWKQEERAEKLYVNQSIVTLPSKKGEHIIEIMAEWPKGEASYTFIIEVR